MELLVTYFQAEILKTRRYSQMLRFGLLLIGSLLVIWILMGMSLGFIDQNAKEIVQSTVSIYFWAFNYAIIPFFLFIPVFSFQIEHQSHTLDQAYFVYIDIDSWIISKIFWIVLLYELNLWISVLGSTYCLQFILSNRLGSAFDGEVFMSMIFDNLYFCSIAYLPHLLVVCIVSLFVRKFSIAATFIVGLHLFSIQSLLAESNPFHMYITGVNIKALIRNKSLLYTSADLRDLYYVLMVSIAVLLMGIGYAFKKIKTPHR